MFACDPGDPDVRVGVGELQFVPQTATPAPLADYVLTAPYYNWSLRDSQLTSAALASPPPGRNLSDIAFDSMPSTPLVMQYRSTAPFTEQDEVLAFSRDNEEMYETMLLSLARYATTGNVGWESEITPGALPAAATIDYPPSATFPSFTFAGAVLSTSAFFGTATPVGVAAAPDGAGSIKTVRVVQHGRCSQEIPYLPATATGASVFFPLLQRYPAALGDAFGGFLQGGYAHFSFQGALAFLHETEDREDSQWGGFFYIGKATVNNGGAARFVVPYFPVLLDDRVSVEPIIDAVQVFGTTSQLATILGSLEAAPVRLVGTSYERIAQPTHVSEVIYQLFDDLQAAEISPQRCTLRPVSGGRVSRTIIPPTTTDQCDSWLHGIVENRIGTNLVPLGLSSAERQRVLDTLMETEKSRIDGATVLRNVRCNPVTPDGQPVDASDPTAGVCELVARAKRINTYPDSIELVWFDDDHEVTAEAYPVFAAEGAFGNPAAGLPGAALCARQPVQMTSSLLRRVFARARQGTP